MRGPTAAALVLGLAALRLWLAARTGLGDDEAYYWHWSTELAWGYREHPPLVAWLIGASTAALGQTPLAVRAPFVLCGALAAALGARLADDLRPGAGPTAALMLSAPPMFGVMAVFAAPDMPMLAAALGAALALRRGAWVWLGICLGLTLWAKLTGALVCLGALIAAGPAGWRRPGLWAALGLAAGMQAPVWAWAAAHGGGPFAYQLWERHRHEISAWQGLGQLVGGQLVLMGPLLLPLGRALRAPPAGGAALRAFAAPTLLVFGLAAPLTDSKIHWLGLAWALLVPAAAALAPGGRSAAAVLAACFGMQALVLAQSQLRVLPVPPRADPTLELRGWGELAAEVPGALAACGLPGGPVAGHMYQTAAQLRWALPAATPVVRVGDRPDQYETWDSSAGYTGGGALFIAPDRYRVDPVKGRLFTRCDALPPVEADGRRFELWCCAGLRADGEGPPAAAQPM